MTPPPYNGDPDAEARYRALLFLHAQSPAFHLDLSGLPGYGDFSVDEALQVVAAAPLGEISVSARLAVLYDLNRAGAPDPGLHAPGYREVAGSALAGKSDVPPGLGPDSLLDDLAASATAGEPFDTTQSAEIFDHHEIAFIGYDDVCRIQHVRVGGVKATWIYSEFETDAPFGDIADWVNPRNWHTWAPLFFRRMDLLAPPPEPVAISPPPPGDQHWHGLFHEEVALVQVLQTRLRCSYWRDPAAAAMTYELDQSLDQRIDVDRGFLLVTDIGPVRRVQVLKIVSFTWDLWDLLAGLVCPFWTDWIRFAVRGGSKSVPLEPSLLPPGMGSPLAACVDAWVAFAGESAKPYIDLVEDAAYRVQEREYTTTDLLGDSTRAWSQLAKDWARAWTTWTQTVDRVAREGLDAGLLPPGVSQVAGQHGATAMFTGPPEKREGTVVPVAGLTVTDRAVSSDLVSIDVGSDTIPAADVAVTVQRLQDGSIAARVQTTNRSVPQGLYVGRLATPDGRPLAPVHLYVSRATGA